MFRIMINQTIDYYLHKPRHIQALNNACRMPRPMPARKETWEIRIAALVANGAYHFHVRLFFLLRRVFAAGG